MADAGRQTEIRDPAPVCAIGTSADGASLRALVSDLPCTSGLAYLVVDGSEGGADPSDLAGRTRMPVVPLGGADRLAPDRIHLAPPGRRLEITGDRVTTDGLAGPLERRTPVDLLFRTLAAARGDGLGVVLSGAGSDGAVGVRAIKEGAGVVLVQDPAEAPFSTMPRAAIATGAADFVLSVRDMGARIAQVARIKALAPAADEEAARRALRRMLEEVRFLTGRDFSGYDEAVMLNRVHRRRQVTMADDLEAYGAVLRDRPEEARALARDLLIPLTMFFRDPAAFETLAETAVPAILDERRREHGVRVWSAGCATGEEAYSLAMLFLEEADRRGASVPVQVFGTDVDATALAVAREGRYPDAIGADVSPERLERFFVREGSHWRVGKRLRDAVLFAEHGLVRDPPFSRMDLDACRNVLGLFGPPMRRRALERMHYALRPDGHLFLGPGEEPDRELFEPLRPEAGLFAARALAAPATAKVVPLPGAAAPPGAGRWVPPPQGTWAEGWEGAAPPSVVVDEERRALHLTEAAGRYLRPSGGSFPQDLTGLARPELRGDLMASLHRALAEGRPSVTTPLAVPIDGERRRVGLHVRPLSGPGSARALVMFLDGGTLGPDECREESAEVSDLREQLRVCQGRLTLCQEERETAEGRLHLLEEEFASREEEHRSAVGELEAIRAERDSRRQELRAIQVELLRARAEAGQERRLLEGLAGAAGIEAALLDAELHMTSLVPTGEGRALALVDLARGPEWARVEAEAGRAMRDGLPSEREWRAADGRRFALRLRPNRGPGKDPTGVIVCLVPLGGAA